MDIIVIKVAIVIIIVNMDIIMHMAVTKVATKILIVDIDINMADVN